MKIKHYSFRQIAFIWLWAMAVLPLCIKADSFTPNMFPGQSADRTELEVSATVKVGEYGKCPNTQSYVTSLSSTNESVVRTYNEQGQAIVLIVGVGTADVTYSEQMYTLGENGVVTLVGSATNHTIHYTVVKGEAVGKYTDRSGTVSKARLIWDGKDPGAFTFTPPNLEISILDVYVVNNVPQMLTKYIYATECELTSSNPSVATVNARSVTPVSYGKTIIRATWHGNDNWYGTTAEYELTVEEPKENIYINFFQTEITGFVGDNMSAPMNLQMHTIDRWTSENPEIASVDEKTGTVTFLSKGTTRIFAHIDETDTHYAATGYYTVNVKKRDPNISFEGVNASDEGLFVYGELNVPFTAPTLLNPNNVTIDKWYSSNTDVAEVNEKTGEVTIKAVGIANITCETVGNNIYEGATASYTLIVSTSGIKVMGVTVTSLNAADVLGNGKVSFDKETRTLNLNNWVIDATELDPAIKKGIIVDETNGALIINPVGECAIINAERCIVSMTGGVVFKSENKTGKLLLTANASTQSIAIQANGVKVHECDITVKGAVVAMKLNQELTVSKLGHIYAEATDANAFVAIGCNSFTIADESIAILTPGVHFDTKAQNFFDDEENKVKSKIVEIGKVPVTAPDDEATLIQFNLTDPNDDAIVFSSTGNDIYNKETGQLEISTLLTDEQVSEALQTLIPGSSAWVASLPGSLVFDIPAGKGEIYVNCQTLPGYTINVMIDGQNAVSITQAEPGWAKINYDVTEATHVVVYLHATSSSALAPSINFKKKGLSGANAYISAIKIVPEKVLGIDTHKVIDDCNANIRWYDLNGRMLNGKPTTKGIYMKNGKKIIIK